MSFMNGILLEDRESAAAHNILKRGINAVEKGNYVCVFTGGGFRIYDKTDYSLIISENRL